MDTRWWGGGRGNKVRSKKESERTEMEVCFPVMLLHWSLSNIRVYILETDRQHLIHMNRQVTLNIACVAEKMKQCAAADILFALAFQESCTN